MAGPNAREDAERPAQRARSLQEEPWGERGPVVSWVPGASRAALLPGTIRGLQGKSFRGNPSGGILQGESSPGGAGPGTGEGTHELPAGFEFRGKNIRTKVGVLAEGHGLHPAHFNHGWCLGSPFGRAGLFPFILFRSKSQFWSGTGWAEAGAAESPAPRDRSQAVGAARLRIPSEPREKKKKVVRL